MSIQEYSEKVISRIEKRFEDAANNLLNAAKQYDHNRCGYLAGTIDALHMAAADVKEVRKLYLTYEGNATQNDTETPLY